jgi:hypothetical protein
VRVISASALVAATLLSGCASTVYEGKYDWAKGWRAAEVVEVTTAAEMERPRFYECVRKAAPQQAESGKFVVVKYRQMSRTQRRAIPLQPGQTFAPGDLVYVKAGDCVTPVVVRHGGRGRSSTS